MEEARLTEAMRSKLKRPVADTDSASQPEAPLTQGELRPWPIPHPPSQDQAASHPHAASAPCPALRCQAVIDPVRCHGLPHTTNG